MILIQLSLFFSCYHDIVLFLLGTSNKCVKLQKKKILVKLLRFQKIFRGRYLRLTFILYYFS